MLFLFCNLNPEFRNKQEIIQKSLKANREKESYSYYVFNKITHLIIESVFDNVTW